VTWIEGNPTALTSSAGVNRGTLLVTQLAAGRLWSRVERSDEAHPPLSQHDA